MIPFMGNRMTIYTVHLRPGDALVNQKPIFIKEGFNFIALLFPVIWSFYQRLWLIGLAFIGLEVVLMLLTRGQIVSHFSIAAISAAGHFLAGFTANDWLRSRLVRQGYVLADITVADSQLRAEQRYFERCLMTQNQHPQTQPA